MTRQEKLLHRINKTGFGLEIGPSYNPLLPKAEGWNVVTVDHCTKDELIEKYKNEPGVDVSRIEDVDYIWHSGTYQELIGKKDYFDHIVASHLLEHIPNPISWLQDVSLMLKDSGYLILALPDRNFCFDFSRPVTTTGQWLQAYSEKREHHSFATMYDSLSYFVTLNNVYTWGKADDGKLSYKDDIDNLYNEYLNTSNKSEYVDFHFSVFTHLSFQLMISELNFFGLTDLVIDESYPPTGCEFIVILRKSKEKISRSEVISIREKYLLNLPKLYPNHLNSFISCYSKIFNYIYRLARGIKRRLKL